MENNETNGKLDSIKTFLYSAISGVAELGTLYGLVIEKFGTVRLFA